MDPNHRTLDFHLGNIVFANNEMTHKSDTDLLSYLGKPDISDVVATSGHALTPRIPRYLVSPSALPSLAKNSQSCSIKVIDFGEASMNGEQRRVRCPLVFRAPEAVLTSQCDTQADIWSLGCTVLHPMYEFEGSLLNRGTGFRADRRVSAF